MPDLLSFADVIFFALIALVIGLKLKSVLGRRDPNEPNGGMQGKILNIPPAAIANTSFNNSQIIDLKAIDNNLEDQKIVDNFKSKEIADQLLKIRRIDPNFTIDRFIAGAKSAFEIILKAFNEGNVKALEKLLDKDILESFSSDIQERNKALEKHENTLVAIESEEIIGVDLDNSIAQITVKFVTEQINITRNQVGEIVGGSPSQIDKVVDTWVFERDLKSTNPNWKMTDTIQEDAA